MTPMPTAAATIWRRSSGRLSPKAPTSTPGSSGPTSRPAASTIAQKIGGLGRKALIDTSIFVDLKKSELGRLSRGLATSTLTIAELARGPGAATDDLKRCRRRGHLEAATALAHDLPLYALNPKDLRGLEDLIEIVDVGD